jgi:hypothetical protein
VHGNGHGPNGDLIGTELGLQVIPARARESSSVAAPAPSPTDGPPEREGHLPASLTYLVFGEPYHAGDKTIISASAVQALYRAPGGAPIYSRTRPVAIIEIDDDGVRVIHIANKRLTVLLWALTLAWLAYWLLRTQRARQPQRP